MKKRVWFGPLILAPLMIGAGAYLFMQSDTGSSSDRFSSPTMVCLPGDSMEDMVAVPGGAFLMGERGELADEGPVRAVEIAPFHMSRTEVTNAQFAEFVGATGYVTVAERELDLADYPGIPPELLKPGSTLFVPPADLQAGGSFLQWWQFVEGASWHNPEGPDSGIEGREHYPVVHVAFEDAVAYAHWKGHRLPTEAEYEYAARGGLKGTRYAWGEEFAPGGVHRANSWQGLFPLQNSEEDGYEGVAPVGCYEANSYGFHDLIGNVWEWTSSPYYPSHAVPPNAPKAGYDPRQPGLPVRVIKGGSYLCAPNYCLRYRPAARHAQDTGLGTGHIGFRTVR